MNLVLCAQYLVVPILLSLESAKSYVPVGAVYFLPIEPPHQIETALRLTKDWELVEERGLVLVLRRLK